MAGKSGRTINAVPEKNWKKTLLCWEGMLVVIFVAVIIFCSFFSSNYTMANIFREMPKYLCEVFLMLPMAFILMMGEIDISVGSIVCLSATLGCLAGNAGAPFPVVILVMVGAGTAMGAINGGLLVKFPELPSMIITLGTQIIFRGIAEIILGGGGNVAAKNTEGFRAIAKKVTSLNIPIMLFLLAAVAVVFVLVSTKMKYGREIMAIGSNRNTAFYSGVKVKKNIFIAFVLMGFFSGVAALFLTAASYGANTQTGKGYEMDAIAMAVFGGIATTGGKGRMIGGLIAAFVIICLRIGLGQRNVNSQLILLIIGVLLIGSVLLPNISSAISAKKKTKL